MERGDVTARATSSTEALRVDDQTRRRTTCSASFSASRGTCPRRSPTSSGRSRSSPFSADAHYNLGVALWYSGAKDRALAELRRAPSSIRRRRQPRVSRHRAARRPATSRARASLQRAIALLAADRAVYVDLGIMYLRADELDQALGQLEAGAERAGRRCRRRTGTPPSPAFAAQSPRTRIRPRRTTCSACCSAARAPTAPRWPPSSARRSACARTTPRRTTTSGSCWSSPATTPEESRRSARPCASARTTPTPTTTSAPRSRRPTPRKPFASSRRRSRWRRPRSRRSSTSRSPTAPARRRGPARQIEQLRKVIELEPSFARAHLALGKALLQDGKVGRGGRGACRRRRGSSPTTARRTISSASRWRAPDARRGHAELQKGRELVAASDRNQNASLDLAEGRAALAKGDLPRPWRSSATRSRLRPDSAEAQAAARHGRSRSRATPGAP